MNSMGGRIVVTGGAGFVGSHLVERLHASGSEVTVVDDLSNGRRDRIPDPINLERIDLTDEVAVDRLIDRDVDLVFHLAARTEVHDDDPRGQFETNTKMTHNVLEACRTADVRRVVYASSSAVYGETTGRPSEERTPLEPISVYGASKAADEALLSAFAGSCDLTVWNCRFTNIVGPRSKGSVVPDFVEKLRANPRRLTILGNGRQEKSYVHVRDAVAAMCHVIESDVASDPGVHTFNVGTHTTTTVDRIAEIVADVLGVAPSFEYTGGDRGWAGDVPRIHPSIAKLADLDWTPELESDEAVRLAAEQLAGRRRTPVKG